MPFIQNRIKEVNIVTDYEIGNKGEGFVDFNEYNNYNLYGYDKIKFNPEFLTQAIFIAKEVLLLTPRKTTSLTIHPSLALHIPVLRPSYLVDSRVLN